MKFISKVILTAAVIPLLTPIGPVSAIPKTPSLGFLAGNFAGGFCLYKTDFYEEDSIFGRVNDAGQDTGMTPEEVQKMVSSPAFMPLVDKIIAESGGCIKLSNEQLRAWGSKERATKIIR